MALRPDASISAGLATVGLVYGVYQIQLPSVTDVRAAPPQDGHVQRSERTATWTAAALVSAVSLIARDMNIFVLGGSAVVAMAWYYRHADHVNPVTKVANSAANSAHADSMPDMAPADMSGDYGTDTVPADSYAFG